LALHGRHDRQPEDDLDKPALAPIALADEEYRSLNLRF
jgi:hypothetical protein